MPLPWQFLADAVLLLHLGVVMFVVGGLLAVPIGARRGWAWVRNGRFRLLHLAAIGFVVVQAWLGRLCPLTVLESWLREQAGMAGYHRGFIEHWAQWLIYHEAPPWVFVLAYTGFGALTAWAWWRHPPRR